MGKEIFDNVYERRNTMSLKYDFAVERGKPADVLPLWVADMDFPGPECVSKAVVKALGTGIYGYTEAKDAYYETVRSWFFNRFGWRTENNDIVKTPGVVFALAMAVKAFTREGDGVLIQPPVYYPFYEVIRDNDRHIVENPLVLSGGRYHMDLPDLEKKIVENNIKLMILCSPHNPVGRVWTTEELRALGKILVRHGVILVSDEIHCDIVFEPNRHHVFAEAVPDMADNCIICTAPSKTFNMAGLQVSNIFIKNPELRRQFKKEIDRAGYSQLNMPGLIACKAAYEEGEPWLEECLDYLKGNLDFIRAFVEKELPGVKLIEPEGTYFAWLDFNGTGLDSRELENRVLYRAKLWLDGGYIFGKPGQGFERIAYAVPRKTLMEAMNRLKLVLEQE